MSRIINQFLSYLNWLNVLVPNPLIVNTFWRYQPLQCRCPRYPQPRVRVAMSSLTTGSTISKRQNQAPFSNRAVHAGYNIKAVPPRDLVFIIRKIWPINNRIYSIPPKDGNLFNVSGNRHFSANRYQSLLNSPKNRQLSVLYFKSGVPFKMCHTCRFSMWITQASLYFNKSFIFIHNQLSLCHVFNALYLALFRT